MAELTAGYEQFIKGKELNNNGRRLFDQAIKKAAKKQPQKIKQRGAK